MGYAYGIPYILWQPFAMIAELGNPQDRFFKGCLPVNLAVRVSGGWRSKTGAEQVSAFRP
jgi:hypothetical protein